MLRAVGLTLARTQWVTFADDDVWWEGNHFEVLSELMQQANWASVTRAIWTLAGEKLGNDRFENDLHQELVWLGTQHGRIA